MLVIQSKKLTIGQSYFNNDGTQLYLIFQPICKTITTFFGLPNITSQWESKKLSNKKFQPPYTTNKILSRKLQWAKSRLRLRFEGSCLKQEDTKTFTPNSVVNLFIVYKLDTWSQDLNGDFTLKDCLFGSVKITKNADSDKYSYSRYEIGFDSRSLFWIPNFDQGKNFIIFGVDMTSSVHVDDRQKIF